MAGVDVFGLYRTERDLNGLLFDNHVNWDFDGDEINLWVPNNINWGN